MNYFSENLKNIFDFSIRKLTKFSRKNYEEKNEAKENIFNSVEEIERENFLTEKYSLTEFKNNSTKTNYLENLYLLDVLDKYLKIEIKDSPNILDIGSKNWSYAKSEYFFFKQNCAKFLLDGIEIDAHRLYSNLYSRKEVAKFHIKGLENTNYIEGNFLNHTKKYNCIIWSLPFIKKYPHLKWGLPLEYFRPDEMLRQAYESLKPSGQMMIINQGIEEFEIQKQLCKRLNIHIQFAEKIESPFSNYKMDRYLILVSKE